MSDQLPKEMDGKILSLQGSSPIFTDTQRDETNRLIFVKRIPGIITALEFAKIAMEYAVKGPILDIKYRRHTGGDKTAFALIYFQEEEDGKGAIEGLNGRHLEFQGQHRVLSAERASRWTQQVSRTNLYVTNLPGHWTGEDLKSVFDKFGKVMQATVLPHPQMEDQNSGAGFVRFGTEEDAAQAMTATDGKPATPGSEKILEVKYAKANIHKSRRNDPLVNAALLKDFRKRKADFLAPASKRMRFSAMPVILNGGFGGYQTLMQRPVMFLPTATNPFGASMMGLQNPLQQNTFLPTAVNHNAALLQQQNQLLQQSMLAGATMPNQYLQTLQPQQQYTTAPLTTQPQSLLAPNTQAFQQQTVQTTPGLTNSFYQQTHFNAAYPSVPNAFPQPGYRTTLTNSQPSIGPTQSSLVKEEPSQPPIIMGAPNIRKVEA